MNATEIKNLIGQKIVFTTKDGESVETILRTIRVHKSNNTLAGITYDGEITSTFEGKTSTMKIVFRMPASQITSIKAGA